MQSERPCFELIWKIENFSKFIQKDGECIESPGFVIDTLMKSKWKLSLYSYEEDDAQYIGFYLTRGSGDRTKNISIDYELLFISFDGRPLKRIIIEEHRFAEKYGYGGHRFIKTNEIFAEKSQFLTHDTLTACCRIWKTNGSDHKRCLARTIIGNEKRKFHWEIDDLNNLEAGEAIKCETVHFMSYPEHPVTIRLYLEEESLNITISQPKTIKKNCVAFKILTINSCRFETEYKHFFKVRAEEQVWHLPLQIKLTQSQQYSIPVTFNCECSISAGVVFNQIEDTYDPFIIKSISESIDRKIDEVKESSLSDSGSQEINVYHHVNQTHLSNSSHALKENINLLFVDGILCDFNIIADKKTFPVHKAVLAARSITFRAMFENDTDGVSGRYLNIVDMAFQNIQCLLRFLYTDTLDDDIDWERASEVYKAAVKYHIPPLKSKCVNILKARLCVSNACEILCFSDLNKENYLKSYVQDFILKHDIEIFTSDLWINFEKQNIQLAVETTRNYFLRKANGFVIAKQPFPDVFRSLEEDICALFEDKILCDFKLKTKTGTFPVHKVVLGASSPVFRAMFESGMKEVKNGTVSIKDVTAETVKRMLTFMYTDSVEISNWEIAFELFVSADKYGIMTLKEECRFFLINNLSVSNACKILTLSNAHQDGRLKSSVIDYVFKYDSEVINSEYWKEFQTSHCNLACETLRELYMKRHAI